MLIDRCCENETLQCHKRPCSDSVGAATASAVPRPLPELPSSRREVGRCFYDPLAFLVKLPMISMRENPDRADRLIFAMKVLAELQLLAAQSLSRKTPFRQVHDLRGVLVDGDAARTGISRHVPLT
jgi:hypothetical protein